MDDAVDPAVPGVDVLDGLLHGFGVPQVDGVVARPAAGGLRLGKGGGHFAAGQDAVRFAFDPGEAQTAAGGEGGAQCRLAVGAGEVRLLGGVGQFGAAEELDAAAGGGQGGRDARRDAARSAREDDHGPGAEHGRGGACVLQLARVRLDAVPGAVGTPQDDGLTVGCEKFTHQVVGEGGGGTGGVEGDDPGEDVGVLAGDCTEEAAQARGVHRVPGGPGAQQAVGAAAQQGPEQREVRGQYGHGVGGRGRRGARRRRGPRVRRAFG
ncbi:hypothetical protein GCM10020000_73860 [Streptomyces olivoverticillatus]